MSSSITSSGWSCSQQIRLGISNVTFVTPGRFCFVVELYHNYLCTSQTNGTSSPDLLCSSTTFCVDVYKPTLTTAPATQVCPGQQVSICPSGGPYDSNLNYSWTGPSGITQSIGSNGCLSFSTLFHSTTSNTSYNFNLNMTPSGSYDNQGQCFNFPSLSSAVNVLPYPIVNVSPVALIVCPGTPVTLLASGNANSYYLSGNPSMTGTSITVIPSVPNTTTNYVELQA